MSDSHRSRCSELSAALAILVIALVPSAVPAQKGEEEKPREWTPERMMQVKRVGGLQVSPDGKRVVFTVRQAVMEGEKSEYLTHIHLANGDGSQSQQLTQGDRSCLDPQWSPDGSRIAFLSSRSGKKNVWLIRPDGGEAQQLTDVKSEVGTFKWSPDGTWIAYTAIDPPTSEEEKGAKAKNDARVVDENIKLIRLYVIPTEKSARVKAAARPLTKGNLSVGGEGTRAGRAAFDWSPDGKTIVIAHTRTPRPDDWPTADLSLVDVSSGSLRPLAHTQAAEFAPLYSPDGRWIAFVASDDPPTWAGTGRVQVVAASGGSPRPLADTFDSFGRYSELVGWSADGKKIYCTEVRHTVFRLLALPLEGPPEEISKGEGMAAD